MKLFTGTPLSQFSREPAPKPARTEAHPAKADPAPAPSAAAARPQAQSTVKPAAARARKSSAALADILPAPSAPRVTPIARLAQGGRWRVEAMRAYSEPVLYWFTRGQGRMTLGGVTRGYGAHNAVFVPAGTMHAFDLGAQVYGSALFFGRGADVQLPDRPLHLRIRDVAPQSELSIILEAIQREIETARPGYERAARHHLGLVGVWLERQADIAAAEEKKPDAGKRLVARFSELLERDFRSGKGIADYAAELGVTPTHLTRVCREACGRPASELLHDRLIFEARRLLVETALPVRAVSEALGFASAAYFTRAFQHRTGKTPTAFRNDG